MKEKKMIVKLVTGESPTAHCLTLGQLDLHFSYGTVVAFESPGLSLIVSENIWSTTTGEHINAIAGKDYPRFPRREFEEMLQYTLMPIAMVMGAMNNE